MLYYWNGSLGSLVGNNTNSTEVISLIDVSNPTKGKMYYNYENETPSNQVFVCGGSDLGSSITIYVNDEMPEIYIIF